jgi:hypothetical protein
VGDGAYATNVNRYDISDYSSIALKCNDRDPFVDMNDGAKVYFASDRYNHENYDLYRYNTEPFTESVLGYSTDVVEPVTPVSLEPGIYVSAAYGDDGNPGTKDLPKATIDGALSALGTNKFIYLDKVNAYELSSILYFTYEGLEVVGGFNSFFTEVTGNSIFYSYGSTLFSLNSCRNTIFKNMDIYMYSASSPVIQVYNSTNCVFENVNILYNALGGGFNIQNSSGISIVNSTIQNCNNTLSAGGGIYMSYSSGCVIDADIIQNLCPEYASGGGIYMSSCNSNTIRGSVISNNCRATSGGGIYMYMSSYNIIAADIGFNSCSSNSYTGYGGGISLNYCFENSINSLIYRNNAYYGGGIYFDNVSTSNIIINRIEYNIATNGSSGYGYGGGLMFDGLNSYNGNNYSGAIVTNNLPINIDYAS